MPSQVAAAATTVPSPASCYTSRESASTAATARSGSGTGTGASLFSWPADEPYRAVSTSVSATVAATNDIFEVKMPPAGYCLYEARDAAAAAQSGACLVAWPGDETAVYPH